MMKNLFAAPLAGASLIAPIGCKAERPSPPSTRFPKR
jgi:hypothetical protein